MFDDGPGEILYKRIQGLKVSSIVRVSKVRLERMNVELRVGVSG